MKYILALDQGTTSSRALLVNQKAQIVAMAQKEFHHYFPMPGFVEHDADEIWSSQFSVAHEVLAKASCDAADIAAIGITNQRETTIVWDRRTSKPICHALVWQDRRTNMYCNDLEKQGKEEIFRKKTGLILDPYFSGTKLKCILDNVEGARQKAEKGELAFGTVDSWLIWTLTKGKVHITDVTNASRTLMFNIHTGQWDEELLEILDIPKSVLGEVRSCSEVYSETAQGIFTAPIPIAGIAGDQQASLFGQGACEKGEAKCTYGTGGFLLINTKDKPVNSKQHLLTTIAWKIGNETGYALEGSVLIAGSVIQWLKESLHLFKKNIEIEELVTSVDDSGGVYFVPALTGLGPPYWDPHLRGTIFGISRGTTKKEICRAAMEGIAFRAVDVLKAMELDSGIPISDLRVDGGVVVSDFLMQFQADLVRTRVLRPKRKELTAIGAASLAGIAVGYWKNKEEISSAWTLEREFSPEMDEKRAQQLYKNWLSAVECARQWEAIE